MPRKSKAAKPTSERSVPSIAKMKFWSRFRNPPTTSAFSVESFVNDDDDDNDDESLRDFDWLPDVPHDDSVAFSLRISLDDSRPTVWRRVHVKSINLETLHEVIQIAIGWDDMHLHGFEVRKKPVPIIEDGMAINEREITLAQLHAAKVKSFRYVYDYGDNWSHTILIERTIFARAKDVFPKCTAGRGSCPHEDAGGIYRWNQMAEEFRHPDPDDEEFGAIEPPPPFEREKTNAELQRVFNRPPRRRRRK